MRLPTTAECYGELSPTTENAARIYSSEKSEPTLIFDPEICKDIDAYKDLVTIELDKAVVGLDKSQ